MLFLQDKAECNDKGYVMFNDMTNILLIAMILMWIVTLIVLYIESGRVRDDLQQYLDECDENDRADKYMYTVMIKEIDHD